MEYPSTHDNFPDSHHIFTSPDFSPYFSQIEYPSVQVSTIQYAFTPSIYYSIRDRFPIRIAPFNFSKLRIFSIPSIQVIAESLSEDEIAGLKEMFKMIDTDNSGHITFEELKAGLEKAGAKLKESEISALMEAADIDNSATIDCGEFMAATMHLNKVDSEDNLFAAFSYFDKDGSGYITIDELQKACEDFGIEDVRLEEVFQEIDQDNDGRIDYNEFVAMMHKGNTVFGKKGQGNISFGLREALKIG